MSNCASGGALSAACSSGSSGARSTDGAVSAVLAPLTDAFDVAGSSVAGARSAGACGFRRRRRHDEAIALQRAIDLGKIGGVITRRRRDERIARHGSRDVDALIVEAGEAVGRGLRRGGSDRTAEREGCDLDGAGGGEHRFCQRSATPGWRASSEAIS